MCEIGPVIWVISHDFALQIGDRVSTIEYSGGFRGMSLSSRIWYDVTDMTNVKVSGP